MKIIPLDKRRSKGLELSMAKMLKVTKQKIDYYVFAMKVKKIEKAILKQIDDKSITILDNGYMYVEILPINKNYTLTMTYDTSGNLVCLLFNVTGNNFLDERKMPYYEDLFLKVIINIDKELFILDKDKLQSALQNNEITKEQYDFALRRCEIIKIEAIENFNLLKEIARKYYNVFFNEYRKLQKDRSNTYRVKIKPGLKVAIVLKKDQKTGFLTKGIVQDILTNSAIHKRGIKVRLTDGQVGRVQKILGE